jgi:hypothetical protein
MKVINLLFIGLISLLSVSAVAQKMVPHSFRHQANPLDRDQLRFLTQVSQPNTTFLRLYFKGTKLGEGSYLVLEGTDGARQELRKQDLENWHYSSAYFNGQSVNVSLFTVAGEHNTVHIFEVKVTDPQAEQARNARKAAKTGGTTLQSAATTSTSANLTTTYPYTKAVGRFTNGSNSFGTGWIAPNGAIVTSKSIYFGTVADSDFDIIEFNVPPSEGGKVKHPAPEDQYPLNRAKEPIANDTGYELLSIKGADDLFIAGWGILEALPNSTGLRPGEHLQQNFRISDNPGSFTIDAQNGIPVDLFHYGSLPSVGHSPLMRTLQQLETELLEQSTFNTGGHSDQFVFYNASALLGFNEDRTVGSDAGAPVTYRNSNFAIGVHNLALQTLPAFGMGFKNDNFRNGLARFFSTNSVYVDPEGLSDPGTGEIHKPFRTANKAANDAATGAQVYFARGTYLGPVTFNRPMTLRAPVGKVVIGSTNGGARRAAESSIARNMAMAEALGAHSRLESVETAERVRVYPNPFREQTEINYPFAEGGAVTVRIFNMAGVPVATFTPKNAASGQTGVQWNGTDQNGTQVPAGLYLVQVNDGRQTFTTKVLKK